MATGDNFSGGTTDPESPICATGQESKLSGTVDEDSDSSLDCSLSVDEICLLAFHDMVYAMAYPYGILTVKQMTLVKNLGRLLRISPARQKVEMRAVFASLQSRRQMETVSQEAIAAGLMQAPPASQRMMPPPPPVVPVHRSRSSVGVMRDSGSSASSGKVCKKQRKEKKNRTRALLRRAKEAAVGHSQSLQGPAPPSLPMTSAFLLDIPVTAPNLPPSPLVPLPGHYPLTLPASSSSSASLPGVHLLNLAAAEGASSSVVPRLLRPVPITPLSATINRVVEMYHGQVRALWRGQGRLLARNFELSA